MTNENNDQLNPQDQPPVVIDPVTEIVAEPRSITKEQAKSAIESLLFINERPIEAKELSTILDLPKSEIEIAAQELINEYKLRSSGLCVVQVAGGYQMCSNPDNEKWLKKMYQERNRSKLSIAALETLAILAYKQPLTKMEIESIRGVNVDGVLKTLSSLDLIKIEGRKEVIGRPFLYITTRKFLEYFGLNSLKDLPKLEDFITLAEKEQMNQTNPEPEQINGGSLVESNKFAENNDTDITDNADQENSDQNEDNDKDGQEDDNDDEEDNDEEDDEDDEDEDDEDEDIDQQVDK